MATLDVSEVFDGDEFTSEIVVKRRSQVMSNKGRQNADEVTVPDVFGVVCAASPNDLERLPEDQRTGKHISIVTQFALRGTGPGTLPDFVGWEGSFFVVKLVEPYLHFGSGFVQAICGSMEYQDPAPARQSADAVVVPADDAGDGNG